MQREIEWAAAVIFAVLGLSQIYAWPWWHAYHQRLADRGAPAIRGYGALMLSAGAIIAVFHNVWSGAATVLTLAGWLFIVEGALCALAPGMGLAGLTRADPAFRRRAIVATGAFSVVVAGVLLAELLLGQGPGSR